jgi:long-chain acyl-CoA synthetase
MNLSCILRRGARVLPDHEAVVFGDRRLTYRDLETAVTTAASRMTELGIGPGDRVALYCENRPEWIMVYYGIIRAGGVVVCVSAAYRGTELTHLIEDSEPGCVVASELLSGRLSETETGIPGDRILVIERDPVLRRLCRGGPALPPRTSPGVDRDADDPCVILYTGGTTGVPKGAMLTHKNLLYTAQNVCYHERTTHQDRGLCFLPLNHVFAGNHIMNATFHALGTVVLHERFDMDEILSSIRENGVTRLYAVPTVFIRILNNPDSRRHLQSVGYLFSAGTSMPSEVVRQCKAAFGLDIHEAYGMTESSSLVTFNHMYRHKIGSVGTPAGIVEVRIAGAPGKEAAPGDEGEILIRGPNVMKGYHNRPGETARALEGGWLHSGDVGRFDEDGHLHIVDRIKDLVITGGLNVYPTEVEEVLYRHGSVEECAVTGLPHPEYGEAVTAFVRLKRGCKTREDELIRFCKERMASYKAPKRVLFVEDFPRTPQGKLLKRELRKVPV